MLLQTLTIGGNHVAFSPSPGGPALPPSSITDNVPYVIGATNNPAAGSNVVINLPNTAGLFVGSYVMVGSKDWALPGSLGGGQPFGFPTTNEVTQVTVVVPNVSITVVALQYSYTTPDIYPGLSQCGLGVTNVVVGGSPFFAIDYTTETINGLGDDAQVSGPFRPDFAIYLYGLGGLNGTPTINGNFFSSHYGSATPPAGSGGSNTNQLNDISSITIPVDGQFIGTYTSGGVVLQRFVVAEMPVVSADAVIMEYPQPDQYIHTPDPVFSTQVIEAGTGSRGNRGFN